MIERILPAEVVVEEAFGDPPGGRLFPEEEAVIARAVDKRRREFTTTRRCARAALARLGVGPRPILPGPRGEPVWPDGIVGSLTHCSGYRAAALGQRARIATLGIDAEPDEPLPDGVLDYVSLAEERVWIAELGGRAPAVSYDRLLFCAKEAVYKAWYPLARRWLGFADARVSVDPAARTFRADLLVPGPDLGGRPLTGFDGRWLTGDGLLVTAIAVPAE